MSIVEPVVNWVYGSYSIGTDALATPVADLSASVTKDEDASERCGGSSLYTILVQTDQNSDHTYLRIVEGEDADLAWEVDMGMTEYVKAAPVVSMSMAMVLRKCWLPTTLLERCTSTPGRPDCPARLPVGPPQETPARCFGPGATNL